MLKIDMPTEIEFEFIALAKKRGLSINALACEAIINYFDNMESESKAKAAWEEIIREEDKTTV